MDPVTVLGLVSSLITIIDVCHKGARLYKELSENGTSNLNSERNRVAELLSSNEQALASAIRSSPRVLSKQDQQLVDVCEKSCRIAKSLHDEIEHVQGSNRAVVVKFATFIVRSRKMAKLERELDQNTRLVDSIAIRRVASQSFRQEASTKQLDESMSRLLAAVSAGHVTFEQLRARIGNQVENATRLIIQHQQGDGQQTRDLIAKNRADASWRDQIAALLQSLFFPEMFSREEEVAEAGETSCSFIFHACSSDWTGSLKDNDTVDTIDATGLSRSRFSQWLRNDEGLFWITGKAGTGKSVIMKYAFQHESATLNLMHWATKAENLNKKDGASGVVLIVLRHFFWKPGSYLQRSVKGLIQSLLWQLIQHVLPKDGNPSLLLSSENLSLEGVGQFHLWKNQKLREAFDRALSALPSHVYTCVFIDALDEGVDEGVDDVGGIQSLIKFLSHSPRVKVCVSSRPEEFSVDLDGMTSIRLQDINEDAILEIARLRLSPLLDKHHPEKEKTWEKSDILRLIRYQSDGIFLWAELVIKDVKKAIKIGETLSEIRRIIKEETPTNIADLFQQMIDKIHPRYMDEMRLYFGMFYIYKEEWGSALNILTMIFAKKEVWARFQLQDWAYFSSADFQTQCKALESRIEVCAAGLIEVEPGFHWPGYATPYRDKEPLLKASNNSMLRHCRRVKLVHRSVGELLLVGDGLNFSGSGTAGWKEESLRACIYGIHGFIGIIPLFPSAKVAGPERTLSTRMLMHWLQQLLMRLGDPYAVDGEADIIHQTFEVCKSASERFTPPTPKISTLSFPRDWFYSLELEDGLLEVFDVPSFASYSSLEAYISSWTISMHPSSSKLTDVLWYNILRVVNRGDTAVGQRKAIMSTLLRAGADPNKQLLKMRLDYHWDFDWPKTGGGLNIEVDSRLSAWTLLLSQGYRRRPKVTIPIFRVFTEHGAQLDVTTCVVDCFGASMFILEVSHLAAIQRWCPPSLVNASDAGASVEYDVQDLSKDLKSRNAVDFFRIRAFFLDGPPDRDRGDSSDRQIPNDDKGDVSLSRKNVNIRDEAAQMREADDVRQNLYIFTEEESQTFQNLVTNIAPEYPYIGSLSQDGDILGTDSSILEFLRSKAPVPYHKTGPRISLPLWYKPAASDIQ